jgi:uncharacterized protein with NRDE domain
LQRSPHGTWLGITRRGRIAVLTNFRERTEADASAAAVSRGEITNGFLLSDELVDEWIEDMLRRGVYRNVGGFSLMCGILRKKRLGYSVVSNRSSLEKGADSVLERGDDEVFGYECEGLSNSLLHDEWPKVKLGKKLLAELTARPIEDEEALIEHLFELLSYCSDEFRRLTKRTNTPTLDTRRNSIFIPKFVNADEMPSTPVHSTSSAAAQEASNVPRLYGTREQTVILISREDGRVVFTERTLWNEKGEAPSAEESRVREVFYIEGWDENA